MPGLVNEARAASSTMVLLAVAIVIIVVTLTLTMGALITDTIRETSQVDTYTSRFAANSTTVANASVMTLANYKITSLTVYNGTGGGAHNVSVATSDRNLTCIKTSLCTLSINNYDAGYEETEDWYLNYTWSQRDEDYAYNATLQGLDALDTTAGFLPIIGIVVIAGVIIAVVTSSYNVGV